jgi:hypothetical protein
MYPLPQFPLVWKNCGNLPTYAGGMLFVLAFRSDVTRRAPRHGISCVHQRFALEKRAGILPNRDAGSKRKLSEIFAQTSQNVHSFSTVDFPVASPKKIMTDYFVKFSFREIFMDEAPQLERDAAYRDARIHTRREDLRREECGWAR